MGLQNGGEVRARSEVAQGRSVDPGRSARAESTAMSRLSSRRGRYRSGGLSDSAPGLRARKQLETGCGSASRRTARGVPPGFSIPGARTLSGCGRRGDRIQVSGHRLPLFGRALRTPQLAGDAGVLVKRSGFTDRCAAACRRAFGLVVDGTVGGVCRGQVVPVAAQVPGSREQGGDRQREGADDGSR